MQRNMQDTSSQNATVLPVHTMRTLSISSARSHAARHLQPPQPPQCSPNAIHSQSSARHPVVGFYLPTTPGHNVQNALQKHTSEKAQRQQWSNALGRKAR